MLSYTYKKTVVIAIAMLMIAVLCSGCGSGLKHISADEAIEIMSTTQDYLIVDVRTKEEYDKRHIPNALNVPIDDIRAGNLSVLKDMKQPLFVYCWTGRRAENAAKILSDRGFTNVYEIGGIVNWPGDLEGTEVETEN